MTVYIKQISIYFITIILFKIYYRFYSIYAIKSYSNGRFLNLSHIHVLFSLPIVHMYRLAYYIKYVNILKKEIFISLPQNIQYN